MSSKQKIQLISGLLASLVSLPSFLSLSAAKVVSMAQPNCQERCGNIIVPYPFGIGDSRCFLDPSYEITCNNNKSVSRPFLRQYNLEVLNFTSSSSQGDIVVNSPIYSTCRDGNSWNSTDFRGSVFSFDFSSNVLYNVGCGNTLMKDENDTELGGCASERLELSPTGCYGINCCQVTLSRDIFYGLDFYKLASAVNASCCTYAFVADKDWFPSDFSWNQAAFMNMNYIPINLTWGIDKTVYPELTYLRDTDGTYCGISPFRDNIIQCECHYDYEGNPYIANGCQVVEACAHCKGMCSRDEWSRAFHCSPSRKNEIIIAGTIGGGATMMVLFIFCIGLIKIIKKKRKLRLKKKFYKRNGGLLLQQKLSMENNSLVKIQIFSITELEKATDNFNVDRVLGQGGQGTVYKGMLVDGLIVAVKKSILVDESQVEQFINEVVILSQINHMNIVQLLGCCLKTEVPLLVYEFISNGTLSQLICNQDEFPLSWEMRLRIAAEVSGALTYFHTATAVQIFHKDVKSSNILLDDKYRAKVADFGTSRLVDIDQTHLTTIVRGTFGYFDPEFFRSSQFTDKSDVYSFGVVLAELLTGKKPILLREDLEERSLVAIFLSSLEDDR